MGEAVAYGPSVDSLVMTSVRDIDGLETEGIDSQETTASAEIADEGQLLSPAGVRIFRQTLDLDLHKAQLTSEEVRSLAEGVFASREGANGANSDRRHRGINPSERLYLIATFGYRQAALQLGVGETSLHVWVSNNVNKPFKDTKPQRVAPTSQKDPNIARPARERRYDVTKNPRPLAIVAITRQLLLIDDGDKLEWQDSALCPQTDPEVFFPEKGGSTREAKMVCAACDVRSECLEYALSRDEKFGIWGGLSERERRRLKKRAL